MHSTFIGNQAQTQVGMDVSDLTHLQEKEPEPSKIERRTASQSESPRTTTSGMKMKSAKYTYNPLGYEL